VGGRQALKVWATVYGPYDTHRSPISVFATRAVEGRRIEVRGNGADLRDFLYIEDVFRIVETVFMDFSVRKVGLKELYTLKWHRKFNTGGPFTIAGGVQESKWPEWIRKFPDY